MGIYWKSIILGFRKGGTGARLYRLEEVKKEEKFLKKTFALSLVFLAVLLLFSACTGNKPAIDYTLNIGVIGSGKVIPNNASYQGDTIAYITVQPDAGWFFERWEGVNRYEVSGQQNNWQILMNDNKSLTAIFVDQNKPGDPGDPGKPGTYYNLNVTSQGRGSVSPNSGSFENGEVINLIVRPDSGWIFSCWVGPNAHEIVEVSGSYHILMDGPKSLTAVFEQNDHLLDIEIVGKGKVEQKLMNEEYGHGSIVRLWAKPDKGWTFKEWKGDIQEKNEIASIEMISDMFVKAIFEKEIERYELTIKKVGQGTVKENLLSEEYADGDLVELKATPASGWVFVEWRGDEKGKKPTLLVEMDSDKTITVVFEEDIEYYFLEVDIEGNGRVTKSPDEEEYEEGQVVTLKAVADSGWEFKEWKGDTKGSNPQIKVTMNDDKYVKAVFVKEVNRYRLNVSVNGNGTVTKSPDQSEYEEGTTVTLTASPGSNSEFTGWSGDASGSGSSVQVTMNGNKNVTANFKEKAQGYKITVTIKQGEGSPSFEPDKPYYEAGEFVTIRGNPTPPYGNLERIDINGKENYGNYWGVEIESVSKDYDIYFYYGYGGG